MDKEEEGVFTAHHEWDNHPAIIIYRGISQASFQGLLLLVVTGLVGVFYERGGEGDLSLISTGCWSVSVVQCNGLDNTLCLNSSNEGGGGKNTGRDEECNKILSSSTQSYFSYTHQGPTGLCNLIGEANEYERNMPMDSNQFLFFSSVGMPFLLLCSQVIATAFFLGYIRQDSQDNSHSDTCNLQKNVKRIALLIQIVFAGCFLFLQNTWKIPGNNLFLAELFFLVSFIYISFHPSCHYSQHAREHYMPTRLLEFVFTLPLLSVAAVTAGGLTDIADMNWVFFTSLFMNLFILCIEYHHHKLYMQKIEENPLDQQAIAVLLLNSWLCAVGFIMECSLVLEEALAMQNRTWAIAGVILVVLYHGFYICLITWVQYVERKNYHELLVLFLDLLSVIGKSSICLTLLGGSIANL